jgi:hypothetical protein
MRHLDLQLGRGEAQISADPVPPRLPWARVVDLANQFEDVYMHRHEIDPEIAVRLARAVLDFQHQLLGVAVVTGPPRR